MSDVEFMLHRNWEQRRHAEEYAARREEEEQERQDLEVIRIVNEGTDCHVGFRPPAEAQRKWLRQTPHEDVGPRNDRKFLKRNRRWKVKAARAAGRMALIMSAASALAGLELLFPLFGLVAVIFYTVNFELQEGRSRLWHKI